MVSALSLPVSFVSPLSSFSLCVCPVVFYAAPDENMNLYIYAPFGLGRTTWVVMSSFAEGAEGVVFSPLSRRPLTRLVSTSGKKRGLQQPNRGPNILDEFPSSMIYGPPLVCPSDLPPSRSSTAGWLKAAERPCSAACCWKAKLREMAPNRRSRRLRTNPTCETH